MIFVYFVWFFILILGLDYFYVFVNFLKFNGGKEKLGFFVLIYEVVLIIYLMIVLFMGMGVGYRWGWDVIGGWGLFRERVVFKYLGRICFVIFFRLKNVVFFYI